VGETPARFTLPNGTTGASSEQVGRRWVRGMNDPVGCRWPFGGEGPVCGGLFTLAGGETCGPLILVSAANHLQNGTGTNGRPWVRGIGDGG